MIDRCHLERGRGLLPAGFEPKAKKTLSTKLTQSGIELEDLIGIQTLRLNRASNRGSSLTTTRKKIRTLSGIEPWD